MQAYSYDLRIRILENTYKETVKDTAEKFSVSENTVYLIKRQYALTGDVYPKKRKSTVARLITKDGECYLTALLSIEPDLTLEELCTHYKEEFKKEVSITTMFNTLKELNYSFKKKTFVDPSKYTEESKKLTESYDKKLSEIKIEDRAYLDEIGNYLNTTPTHGRAKKGYKVREKKSIHASKKANTIALLSEEGFIAQYTYTTSLTENVFIFFLKYYVLPCLNGRTLIMDNHPAHKTELVINFMKENNISYLFLPPYSPELNPIEEAFSKIKNIIKKYKPRILDRLKEVIKIAFKSISLDDISGFFHHAFSFSKFKSNYY
jgi:transposase